MSERIDWGRVLSGDPDPWRPDDAARVAEHAEQRAEWEARLAADPEWQEQRRRGQAMAAYLAGRGNWIGTSGYCPEHEAEQRAADDGRHVVIEKVDHTCWLEDQRLQQRLRDAVLLQQAEADGGLRSGTFYQGQPTNETGREMARTGQERMVAVGQAMRLGPG